MSQRFARAPSAHWWLLVFTLSLAFGCPSGDKVGEDSAGDGEDCGVSTTTLTVSLVAADEYTETFFERYPEEGPLLVFLDSLEEQPDSVKPCTNYFGTPIGNYSGDIDEELDVEVPVGWICGWARPQFPRPVPGTWDYIGCDGEMVPMEVSGCSPASTSIVIGCEYVLGSYADLHAAPRYGSLQVGAGLPAPQTERHQASPRWRSPP